MTCFAPRSIASFLALAALLVVSGCAAGDDDAPGVDLGPRDLGPGDASTVDMRVGCGSGEHMCPEGCVDDREDLPANGCQLACASGACTAPAGGTSICAAGLCDFTCAPPFVRTSESCACTPRTCADLDAMCGTPDDGCGTPLSCGTCGGASECTAGACLCTPDVGEPNDVERDAISLGATNDADDGPTLTNVIYNSDDALDVDFYEVDVTDGTDLGNPALTVTLDGMPVGTNLDLVAWYRCTAGGDSHSCTSGTAYSGAGGAGCASSNAGTSTETIGIDTECSTTNDSGRLLIRVATTGFGACGNYRLVVRTR